MICWIKLNKKKKVSRFHRIFWAGRAPQEPEPLRPTLKCVARTRIKPCSQCCLHQALTPGAGAGGSVEGFCSSLVSSGSVRTTLHSSSAWYWKEEALEWWFPPAKKNHPNSKKGNFSYQSIPVSSLPPSSGPWSSGCHQPLIHGWCVGTAQLVTGDSQGFQALLCSALLCPEISGPPQWLWQRTRVFLWCCNYSLKTEPNSKK